MSPEHFGAVSHTISRCSEFIINSHLSKQKRAGYKVPLPFVAPAFLMISNHRRKWDGGRWGLGRACCRSLGHHFHWVPIPSAKDSVPQIKPNTGAGLKTIFRFYGLVSLSKSDTASFFKTAQPSRTKPRTVAVFRPSLSLPSCPKAGFNARDLHDAALRRIRIRDVPCVSAVWIHPSSFS